MLSEHYPSCYTIMKYLIAACVVLHLAYCRTLPSYLKQYSCSKNDPHYEKCIWSSFENARKHFMKGIPELGLPGLDPFVMPLMAVNRTINDLVRINAVCTDIKVTGGRNAIIEDIKADPIKHYGEIRLTVPWMYLDMDYDVNGQLLVIPLQSKGHFVGNFTNTQMFIKGSLKTYQNDGVEYLKVNKVNAKITVGGGHIKLTSKDPDFQYAADLIADFFNENPRRVMDAVNPIFLETTNELLRVVSDQILAMLPASEWLPA